MDNLSFCIIALIAVENPLEFAVKFAVSVRLSDIQNFLSGIEKAPHKER